MSKRFETPTSRLICFGSARSLTQSSVAGGDLEDDLVRKIKP